jgi:hypothetical protein
MNANVNKKPHYESGAHKGNKIKKGLNLSHLKHNTKKSNNGNPIHKATGNTKKPNYGNKSFNTLF